MPRGSADGNRAGGYRIPQGVPTLLLLSVVFLVTAAVGGAVSGLIVAAVLYGVLDEYTDIETEVPWSGVEGRDPATTATTTSSEAPVEGPRGEVRRGVPESMSSFDRRYDVYLTATRPVSVEIEPPAEGYVALARAAADRAGLDGVLDRLYPALPTSIEREVEWRVRRDLDHREVDAGTDLSPTSDERVLCGHCDVAASDEFDGFEYSVTYDGAVVAG